MQGPSFDLLASRTKAMISLHKAMVNMLLDNIPVVYFPQGHGEQVAASLKKDVDAQIPNCSNHSSKLDVVLFTTSPCMLT